MTADRGTTPAAHGGTATAPAEAADGRDGHGQDEHGRSDHRREGRAKEARGTAATDVAALFLRARAGDGGAWSRLVERYSGLLWSIARSHGLGAADAGDAVQTTWLRLVERIDRIEEPAAVGRWLVVTARREALHLARRAKAHGTLAHEEPLPAPAHTAPERLALAREELGEVAAALARLPRRCRDLLRLAAAAPSQVDLAAALGMPVGSVGPTRARCLARLARTLAS